jgi:anti-sigma factor RsiW
MTTDISVMGHADDADLVRLLDDEAPDAERGAIESHLTACGSCARRFASLKARSARLSDRLTASDLPAPAPALRPARRRRVLADPRWRVAAALVLLLGGTLLVEPVRAWIVDAAGLLWAKATGHSRATPMVPAPAPAPAPGAGSVTFVPAEPGFTVQVTRRQAEGSLTVETGAGPEASAAIAGGEGPAELVVMPDGLRIVNAAASTRSYHVRVPPSVSRVVIEVGGTVIRVVPAPASGLPLVVNLQRPR